MDIDKYCFIFDKMGDSNTFENDLKNSQNSVVLKLNTESDQSIISFAGLAGKLGIPVYEFFNILTYTNANQLFLRDINKYWFHNGIPEAPGNIDDIVSFLKTKIDEISPKKVITLGNSGGAYAAILFGNRIRVNEVHAFSPRTFLNPFKRLFTLDRIFLTHYKKVLFNDNMQKKYFDLKNILHNSSGETTYHLYYAQLNRIDRIHCERMKNIPKVILHPYEYDQHSLVRYLKNNGQLQNIIKQFTTK